MTPTTVVVLQAARVWGADEGCVSAPAAPTSASTTHNGQQIPLRTSDELDSSSELFSSSDVPLPELPPDDSEPEIGCRPEPFEGSVLAISCERLYNSWHTER